MIFWSQIMDWIIEKRPRTKTKLTDTRRHKYVETHDHIMKQSLPTENTYEVTPLKVLSSEMDPAEIRLIR